jgi:hypothetical protein
MSNAERAKRYRERIKADPEKAQAWRNKAASRMRKKRSVAQHPQNVAQHPQNVAQHGAQQPCEPSVGTPAPRKPTPEERAALLAAFDEPIPLMEHPFVRDVLEQIPCTLVRELEPSRPKPFNNSANQLPRLPGESTSDLSVRRNRAWYEDNRKRLRKMTEISQ